ncbi:hypothetical protein CEXT_492681 [Caerostris extrusa]|uniref:Uncharacterized protein n=1 Tax=Caerostris extrusa TaxID=172846 RepID=A0AAV4P675_CAEEX|nr:hypothetical protein CEXT_492681 [Caerostris extrusa]
MTTKHEMERGIPFIMGSVFALNANCWAVLLKHGIKSPTTHDSVRLLRTWAFDPRPSVSWTRVLLRNNPGVRTCVMEVALLGARSAFMLNASAFLDSTVGTWPSQLIMVSVVYAIGMGFFLSHDSVV